MIYVFDQKKRRNTSWPELVVREWPPLPQHLQLQLSPATKKLEACTLNIKGMSCSQLSIKVGYQFEASSRTKSYRCVFTSCVIGP